MLIQMRKSGPCTLWQSADQYVMRGPSGEHRLSRDCTGLIRLQLHWEGFCLNNGQTPEPDLAAGDETEVYVNQGWREARVLAVLGNKALVEYTMPAGTTALTIYEHAMGQLLNSKEIAWAVEYAPLGRSVSYRKLSKRWIRAMWEQGTEWQGNSQSGFHPFPKFNDQLNSRS